MYSPSWETTTYQAVQFLGSTSALDLEDADFISSSGVGWLLHTHKQFEKHGGKLELREVSKPIDQVLRLMRLQSVLHWT
jgi:anti-anti-sigma factor